MEGNVLETYFNIQCPGWQDEDGVTSYKVFNGKNLIQHGQGPTLAPTLLPLGPHQNNYTYKLTVEIFDNYNSFSVESLTVTVSTIFLFYQFLKTFWHQSHFAICLDEMSF